MTKFASVRLAADDFEHPALDLLQNWPLRLKPFGSWPHKPFAVHAVGRF